MGSIDRRRRLAELRPYVKTAREMRGWKFDVHETLLGSKTAWDCISPARQFLANARSVLDMGTGGGEGFSKILQGYTGLAVATEGWPPNVGVAREKLSSI